MNKVCKLFFVFIMVTVVSCTKRQAKDQTDAKETLRVGILTEPPTLDWNKASDVTSALFINNLMDGLVANDLNSPDLTLVPRLAESWYSNKKLDKWTFKIRKGVKWSDGVEFTAQHVVDGWQRLLNPSTTSTYSYFLYPIKNAKAYNEGKIKDPKKLGITINKNGDIEVQLEDSMSFFPMLMAHVSTYPVRLDVINKHGNLWTEPDNIVSLGAYTLKQWKHDSDLLLQRNESFYRTPAKIKFVKAYIISDLSTMLNLFNSGKLDVQRRVPALQLASLSTRDDYYRHSILALYYLGFNNKKAPTDNKKVRQALSLAIDRDQILKVLNAGHSPAGGWIPPGMFGYETNIGIKLDVKKANKLLDEAGYKDRSTFPKIYYSYNTDENNKRVAENIQAQLKKNLKINVEVRNEEWKVYLSRLKSDPTHIFRMSWVADYPDPDNFLNFLVSGSANNYVKWSNKEFDRLVAKGIVTADQDKRRDIYLRAQKLIVEEDFPAFPVFYLVEHKLINKRVKNYPLNALNEQRWEAVELVE